MLMTWHHEGPEIDFPPGTHKFLSEDFYVKILQIWSFDNQKYKVSSASEAKVPSRYWELNPQPLY